jgi:hypothetical protein
MEIRHPASGTFVRFDTTLVRDAGIDDRAGIVFQLHRTAKYGRVGFTRKKRSIIFEEVLFCVA